MTRGTWSAGGPCSPRILATSATARTILAWLSTMVPSRSKITRRNGLLMPAPSCSRVAFGKAQVLEGVLHMFGQRCGDRQGFAARAFDHQRTGVQTHLVGN